MLISFIVPAYNEEVMIGATLATLFASTRTLRERCEVIVVNDGSTDATEQVAREQGAQVVDVSFHQIAAARNAGARAANGDLLIFVDADTLVPGQTLRQTLAAIERGAVGGGARVRMDLHDIGWWTRALADFSCWLLYRLGFAGGCYIFARREAFLACGGFDERYFASEEIHLRLALGKLGRFVMVPAAVTSSGRKMRLFTTGQLLRQTLALVFRGLPALRRREGLDLWYDGRRETTDLRTPLKGEQR